MHSQFSRVKLFHFKNKYSVAHKTECVECNMQILCEKLNYASTTFDQIKTYLFCVRILLCDVYMLWHQSDTLYIIHVYCTWMKTRSLSCYPDNDSHFYIYNIYLEMFISSIVKVWKLFTHTYMHCRWMRVKIA